MTNALKNKVVVDQRAALNRSRAVREPSPPPAALLVDTTQTVCTGLLGILPEPISEPFRRSGDVIIALVRYQGAWSGTFSLEYGVFEAMQLAHRLLGPADDILSHAVDLVGELANMIAGRLNVAVARGVETAMPEVAVFSAGLPRRRSVEEEARQSFVFEGGLLVVSFQVDGEPALPHREGIAVVSTGPRR